VVAEWIQQLATKGGAALVGAAATDAWQSARSGVVRLFGRAGSRRQDLAEVWLDEDAAALQNSGPDERVRLRSELAPAWQQRMADMLTEFPEMREELEAWINQVQSELPAAEQSWVQTNFAGRDAYVVQHGNQYFYQTRSRRAGEETTSGGPE
jgi:hypothetical protein